MKSILVACVLAVTLACGHVSFLNNSLAADSIVYYGPTGNVLPAGQYQRAEITWKDGKPVMTVTVVMTVGGNVPVPPIPVPDITSQISSLIALVTADPNKAETSKGIAEAYKQILAVAATGQLKDVATLRKLTETIIDAALSDPKVAKASTWKPFTDGMKSLTASMDFAGVVSAYTIAQGLLGGGPSPPPPPPPPPVPTTVTTAMILYESQQLTPKQNLLLNNVRNDQWLKTKKIQILDQNSKGPKGVSVPQVNAALQAASGKQLPLLIGFNVDGSVALVDSLPDTVEVIVAKLKAAGL